MLYTIVVSLWFLGQLSNADNMCPKGGVAPAENSGTNNYVIDYIEEFTGVTALFPYAIGKCTSHSVYSVGNFFIHTCEADGSLSTQAYTDSECTTTTGAAMVINAADYDAGELGYYVCNGENTYSELNMAVSIKGKDDGCSNLRTIYAGLNGCVNLGAALISVYCDSGKTSIQWFVANAAAAHKRMAMNAEIFKSLLTNSNNTGSNMTSTEAEETTEAEAAWCTTKFHCYDWTAIEGESCEQVGAISGISVYGRAVTCTGTQATTTTGTGTTGTGTTSTTDTGTTTTAAAASPATLLGTLIAVIIALTV